MTTAVFAVFLVLISAAAPARVHGPFEVGSVGVAGLTCAGDCDGDGRIAVSELITGVNIALGHRGIETCSAFDNDANGRVSVSELVSAVNAALHGCEEELASVLIEGTCRMPASPGQPGDARGLVNCTEGTPVRAFTCEDSTRCLDEGEEVVYVGDIGPNGDFTARIEIHRQAANRLVFEAELPDSVLYRTVYVGPVSNPAAALGGAELTVSVLLSPASEAAVRILEEEGLENFDAAGVTAVIEAVEQANAETDFTNLNPAEAADLAEDVARMDETVQQVLETVGMPSPTVTPTPTLTPTPTVEPTVDVLILEDGVAREGSISAADQQDDYRFDLAVASRVRIAVNRIAVGSGRICLRFQNESTGSAPFVSCKATLIVALENLGAGRYALQVYEEFHDAHIGQYRLTFDLLSPIGAQRPALVDGGAPREGSIEPAAEVDIFRLDVDVFSAVRVAVDRIGVGPGRICLRIHNESSRADGFNLCNASLVIAEPNLEAGRYAIEVYEEFNDEVIAQYRLTYDLVRPVGSQRTVIVEGNAVQEGGIALAAEVDLYRLDVDVTSTVRFALDRIGDGPGSICLLVENDTTGQLVHRSCNPSFLERDHTLVSGRYVVMVYEDGNDQTIDEYRLFVDVLFPIGGQRPVLLDGVRQEGSIDHPAELDIYQFNIETAGRTCVELERLGSGSSSICLNLQNEASGTTSFFDCHSNVLRADRNLSVGRYAVIVSEGGNDQTIDYSVRLLRSPCP